MNEVDKFFEDLPTQDRGNVDELLGGEAPKPEKEEEEEPLKNRRERRLAEKYERERESAIALNQRVIDLAEEVKTLRGQKQESKEQIHLDPDLTRAFGTTPEGLELTRIFQDKFQGLETKAVEKAKAELFAEMEDRKYQQEAELEEETNKESQFLDREFERLEDDYNVDFSNTKFRQGFVTLVEKLSSKYENGAIKEYPDLDAAMEIYKATISKPEPSRAKEIASRSMQQSTGSGVQQTSDGPMTFAKAKQYISRLSGN